MRTITIRLWIVFLISMPTIIIAQTKDRDVLSVGLNDSGKPFKLNINLAGGSVSISTHKSSELRIVATLQESAHESKDQGKNRNNNINTNTNANVNTAASSSTIAGNKLLKVSQNGNEVLIGQQNENLALHVELSLPEISTLLKLFLNGKGDIDITGVAGQLEITSTNGPIILKNIAGSAVANTVNGNITATFRSVNTKSPMAFSTLNGDIDLSFPPAVKASLAIKSDEGNLFSSLNLTGPARNNLIRSKNGQYQTKLAGSLSGNLNGGGQRITITNMTGNIYLRKSN